MTPSTWTTAILLSELVCWVTISSNPRARSEAARERGMTLREIFRKLVKRLTMNNTMKTTASAFQIAAERPLGAGDGGIIGGGATGGGGGFIGGASAGSIGGGCLSI